MKVDDVGVVGKRDHKVSDRRADIADHHAADDEHGHLAHRPGEEEYKAHAEQGPSESRRDHAQGTDLYRTVEGSYHHQRHHQLGARRDAQSKGACDRVVKESLEQIAGQSQRTSQDGSGQRPGKADVQNDVPGHLISAGTPQDEKGLAQRDLYTAGAEIDQEKAAQQYQQC